MEALAASGWFGAVAGLAVGLLLGAVARAGRFCTLAALERHWYGADASGVRMLILALAVAVAATQAMDLAGLIALGQSFYLSPALGLTGAILGGLMFGFGMALVGACGFSALVQLGGGSLRALIALAALGFAALIAQRGLLAPLRQVLVDDRALDLPLADQSLGGALSALTGVDLRLAVAVAAAAALFWWALRDRAFRARRGMVATGAAVGLLIAAGWAATSYAAARAFIPVQIESAAFVAPVGEFMLHATAFAGTIPDYGVGLVLGVPLGAALVAIRRRDVRWEACDDARELGRHLGGAALMGVGGVFAMGCTVGQGLSAASALAISAPFAMVAIAAGARLGLAWLLEGSIRHAFTASRRSPAE